MEGRRFLHISPFAFVSHQNQDSIGGTTNFEGGECLAQCGEHKQVKSVVLVEGLKLDEDGRWTQDVGDGSEG